MTLLTSENEKEYLKIMKEISKNAGYNPGELTLAHDGKHKLDYNGIKFGNIDYPDFVLFFMNKEYNEASEHRENFLTRTANMRGEWRNNPFSKNNLARRIIWFSDE